MLPSIILFLALVSLIWGILSIIVNYTKTLIEKKSIDLTTAMWLLVSSAALFSLLFYLTHWNMENPQEFLDRNLEELKALQIDEVKVIDGVRLKGETSNSCCDGCIFRDCNCESTADDCSFKAWDFVIVEVDENDNLKN